MSNPCNPNGSGKELIPKEVISNAVLINKPDSSLGRNGRYGACFLESPSHTTVVSCDEKGKLVLVKNFLNGRVKYEIIPSPNYSNLRETQTTLTPVGVEEINRELLGTETVAAYIDVFQGAIIQHARDGVLPTDINSSIVSPTGSSTYQTQLLSGDLGGTELTPFLTDRIRRPPNEGNPQFFPELAAELRLDEIRMTDRTKLSLVAYYNEKGQVVLFGYGKFADEFGKLNTVKYVDRQKRKSEGFFFLTMENTENSRAFVNYCMENLEDENGRIIKANEIKKMLAGIFMNVSPDYKQLFGSSDIGSSGPIDFFTTYADQVFFPHDRRERPRILLEENGPNGDAMAERAHFYTDNLYDALLAQYQLKPDNGRNIVFKGADGAMIDMSEIRPDILAQIMHGLNHYNIEPSRPRLQKPPNQLETISTPTTTEIKPTHLSFPPDITEAEYDLLVHRLAALTRTNDGQYPYDMADPTKLYVIHERHSAKGHSGDVRTVLDLDGDYTGKELPQLFPKTLQATGGTILPRSSSPLYINLGTIQFVSGGTTPDILEHNVVDNFVHNIHTLIDAKFSGLITLDQGTDLILRKLNNKFGINPNLPMEIRAVTYDTACNLAKRLPNLRVCGPSKNKPGEFRVYKSGVFGVKIDE